MKVKWFNARGGECDRQGDPSEEVMPVIWTTHEERNVGCAADEIARPAGWWRLQPLTAGLVPLRLDFVQPGHGLRDLLEVFGLAAAKEAPEFLYLKGCCSPIARRLKYPRRRRPCGP